MKIVTISDTHGKHDYLTNHGLIPDGDVIIHAGDATPNGKHADIEEFLRWFGDLKHKKKIMIAGNHDWGFQQDPATYEDLCKTYGIIYLKDSGYTYKGVKFWGSPFTPEFHNWAFNRKRTPQDIGKHWDLIPNNIDVLITHGPPFSYLDTVDNGIGGKVSFESVGCELLLKKVLEVKPKLHVFGHIHESRGVVIGDTESMPITFNNASSLDGRYKNYPFSAFSFDWQKLILGHSRGED